MFRGSNRAQVEASPTRGRSPRRRQLRSCGSCARSQTQAFGGLTAAGLAILGRVAVPRAATSEASFTPCRTPQERRLARVRGPWVSPRLPRESTDGWFGGSPVRLLGMRKLLLALMLLACPAFASREFSVWNWRSLDAVVSTDLFGDVTVRCQADAHGFVQGAEVRMQDAAVVVPASWIAKLPRVLLSTLDVRTERGRKGVPSLYLVFRDGPPDHKGTT